MKLSKFDIGAEIISIITKGMYPDPKDALREYIQNGIDAKASAVNIRIRQESIVIQDNGKGMNRKTLRNAVRMGVSDKNPSKDVGFMGIGIYSSFHLCGKMTIYSMGDLGIPNMLTMDFAKMKEILDTQRERRQEEDIDSSELIDLQSLLETCIDLSEDGEIAKDEFPTKGTRVELSHVEGEFYSALSDFDEVSEYLKNVVPLHFDKKNFTYAEAVESKIREVCKSKNQDFEIIDLSLQVNSREENLFRPYRDIDFHKSAIPKEPEYELIEDENNFYGIAWGCLNSVRAKITNRSLRGFILKKQGFSIGRREAMVKYFPRGNTFFDRYSGEIIIVNQKILPNASRNDIEYSPLRSTFLSLLTEVASKFDEIANTFQEESKADDDLAFILTEYKDTLKEYNEYEEDSEELIKKIVVLNSIIKRLNGRINRQGFSTESESNAKELLTQIRDFEVGIQNRVKELTAKKKEKSSTNKKPGPTNNSTFNKVDAAKNVRKLNVSGEIDKKEYEDLTELLVDLEFDLNDRLINVLNQIDELFIQGMANNKAEYYELLQTLKERIEDELE